MSAKIKRVFVRSKIEYFAPIAYSDCRKTRPYLADRLPFATGSVLVFLLPYYVGETENFSRYAASLDYHHVIKAVSDSIICDLKKEYPNESFAAFGDHSPIDERHAALVTGLGVLGDNGLLINEKYGSYVFIGEIFTSLAPREVGAISPLPIARCEGCGACAAACLTGRLSGGGECLSEITQRKGELSPSDIELMRKINTVWGCDECQIACPHNKNPIVTPIELFWGNRITVLTESLINGMSDGEFALRAFSWRCKETVLRNIRAVNKKKDPV